MEDNHFTMFDVSHTSAAAPNPVRTT